MALLGFWVAFLIIMIWYIENLSFLMVYLGRYIWRGIWYFPSERSVIVLRKSGPIQVHLDLVALACCVANSPWAMLGVDTDLWRAPPDPTGLPSTPPCASIIPSPIICLEPGWCWWWLWPPPPPALTSPLPSSSSLSPVLSLGLLTRPLLAAARRCPPLPVARWPAFPCPPPPRPRLRGVSRVSPSAPDSIAREGQEEESLDSTACFSTPTFWYLDLLQYIDCLYIFYYFCCFYLFNFNYNQWLFNRRVIIIMIGGGETRLHFLLLNPNLAIFWYNSINIISWNTSFFNKYY